MQTASVTGDSTGRMSVNGYFCQQCGSFVGYGTWHVCNPHQATPYIDAPLYDHALHQKIDKILGMMNSATCKSCAICDKDPGGLFAQLPYGSAYDGAVVCADCIRRHVDPIIDLVKVNRS